MSITIEEYDIGSEYPSWNVVFSYTFPGGTLRFDIQEPYCHDFEALKTAFETGTEYGMGFGGYSNSSGELDLKNGIFTFCNCTSGGGDDSITRFTIDCEVFNVADLDKVIQYQKDHPNA